MVVVVKPKQYIRKLSSFCLNKTNWVSAITILTGILLILFIISFAVGRYPVSPLDVVKVLTSKAVPIDHT